MLSWSCECTGDCPFQLQIEQKLIETHQRRRADLRASPACIIQVDIDVEGIELPLTKLNTSRARY
jgi:hypothetical protein